MTDTHWMLTLDDWYGEFIDRFGYESEPGFPMDDLFVDHPDAPKSHKEAIKQFGAVWSACEIHTTNGFPDEANWLADLWVEEHQLQEYAE